MKNLIILALVVCLCFVGIMTNPEKATYASWIKDEMQQDADNILESGLAALLGEKIINESTQSNDYMIFLYIRLT